MLDDTTNIPVAAPHERETASSPNTEPFGEGIDIEAGNSQAQQDSQSNDNSSGEQKPASDESEQAPTELLGSLPAEMGALLMLAGVIGVVLPGPFGMPLLIASGVTLWPKTFQPIERWFCKRFPAAHQEGVHQIKEFMKNLEKRFPEKKQD